MACYKHGTAALKVWLLGGIVVLLAAGCATTAPVPPQDESQYLRATLMRFAIFPQGELRLLASERFLRLDDSREPGRYWLYDDRQKRAFEVDQAARRIRDLAPLPAPQRRPLNWQLKAEPSQALVHSPSGAKAMHYAFLLDGQPCYDMVVLQGRLERPLALLKAYRSLRAAHDFAGLAADDRQRLCGGAFAFFQPEVSLQYGFPIREWGATGHGLFLNDFRPGVMWPAADFRLPDNYERVSGSK